MVTTNGGKYESNNETEKEALTDEGWTVVTKGFQPKTSQPTPIKTHNAFSILSANNGPKINPPLTQPKAPAPEVDYIPLKKKRTRILQHRKDTLRRLRDSDKLFLDTCITQAKDERTAMAKENTTNVKPIAIVKAHRCNKHTIGLLQ
jgi:hypothetical protein